MKNINKTPTDKFYSKRNCIDVFFLDGTGEPKLVSFNFDKPTEEKLFVNRKVQKIWNLLLFY